MSLLRQTYRITQILASRGIGYIENSANNNLMIIPRRNVKRWVGPTMRELKKRRAMLGPDPTPNRKTFIEWNYQAELYAFGKRLNEEFNEKILQQAFTHRSYIEQEEDQQKQVGIDAPITNLQDNQQLKIDGEKLLKNYVTKFIQTNLPKLPIDAQTGIVQYLLNEEHLAKVSKHIGTHDLILCSEHPVPEPILADTFKAIVGAILKSTEQKKRAELFVRDFVCTQLNQIDINDLWTTERPIELLQKLCAEQGLGKPEPRLIGNNGALTILSTFYVGIYCDRKILATGFGENVDEAISVAARNCIIKLFATDNLRPFNFKTNDSYLSTA